MNVNRPNATSHVINQRFRVHSRLFRKPLIVLQVPAGVVEVPSPNSIFESYAIKQWRDATVEDLGRAILRGWVGK